MSKASKWRVTELPHLRLRRHPLTLQDDFAAPNIHAPLTGNNYTIDGIQPCSW